MNQAKEYEIQIIIPNANGQMSLLQWYCVAYVRDMGEMRIKKAANATMFIVRKSTNLRNAPSS